MLMTVIKTLLLPPKFKSHVHCLLVMQKPNAATGPGTLDMYLQDVVAEGTVLEDKRKPRHAPHCPGGASLTTAT